jgi:hypothetical protein
MCEPFPVDLGLHQRRHQVVSGVLLAVGGQFGGELGEPRSISANPVVGGVTDMARLYLPRDPRPAMPPRSGTAGPATRRDRPDRVGVT